MRKLFSDAGLGQVENKGILAPVLRAKLNHGVLRLCAKNAKRPVLEKSRTLIFRCKSLEP